MPFVRGVAQNVVAALVLILGTWLLSHLDASVALWVLFVVLVVSAILGYQFGHAMRVGEDLAGYHAEHLTEITLTLREIMAGQLKDVSFEEFIENGVLSPARYGLTIARDEEIRLAVIEPDAARQEFHMTYAAGHSVGRKQNFRLSMVSLAGHAYESRKLEWTNDVEKDDRWSKHEKAKPSRAYCSLVAMPVVVGGDVVAVLNVLSTECNAFLKGDLTYIELLGTLIGLAWTVRPVAAATPITLSQSQESRGPGGKGNG